VNIGYDVAQIGLQQLKVGFQVIFTFGVIGIMLFLTLYDLPDLGFTGLDARDYFLALEFLKGKNLV
jgi:hypothetical protein